MANAAAASPGEVHHHRKRIVWAGIVGNVMEWYDFAIYGFLARTIGSLFFPADDPNSSLLAALMRPLGAILFGHIGDRVGRGPALLWSVVAMAVPTLIMGLLPTYAEIGIWASILMLLCRMMQGLAVGGEYTSSAVFLAETAEPHRRGAASAWAVVGATSGILLGSAVGALVLNVLPLDQVVAWGWRIPFIFGVLVGVAGFIIRRRLPFDKPVAHKGSPLLQALREHPVAMLQAVAISLVNAVAFYLIFVYLIAWLKLAADLGARTALQINSLNMVIMIGVMLVTSRLSDRIGRRPILLTASIGLVLFSWPLFQLMRTGEVFYVFLGQLGFTLLIGPYNSINPIVLCEIFPRHVRCSAVSAAYNLSFGLAGGTAPALVTWLIESTGDTSMPAFYIMACAAISAAAAFSLLDLPRDGRSVGDRWS